MTLKELDIGSNTKKPDSRRVADSIILNGKALVPSTEWKRLLGEELLSWSESRGERNMSGKGIASKTVAPTMELLRKRMEWTLYSPGIVYMSGCYLLQTASERLQSLEQRVKEIESGARFFLNPEQRMEEIAKGQNTISLLADFHSAMKKSLEEYSRNNLPQGDINNVYSEILEFLLNLKTAGNVRKKREILNSLAAGKINTAYEIIGSLSK